MTVTSPPRARSRRPQRKRKTGHRLRWAGLAIVLLAAAGAAAVWAFSGARLLGDSSALGRVDLEPFAGSLVSVEAHRGDGTAIPISVSHGRLTPRVQVAPGEPISLSVVVRRPGWESWALGSERRETLTVKTPVANAANRWVTAQNGHAVVHFDAPVDRVSVPGAVVSGRTVTLPAKTPAGSVSLAIAARAWEKLGAPARVTWFPRSDRPMVLVSPRPGGHTSPLAPITLTFSVPAARALGGTEPTIKPSVTGHWQAIDDHTVVFRPTGAGLPFDSRLTLNLPAAFVVAGKTGTHAHTTKTVPLSVAPASFLRLQQLLAQEGYLPLDWTPAHPDPKQTLRSQLAAAVDPPEGRFEWTYPNTPLELQALWRAGEPNEITRGAVMMFEDEHDLTVDAIAGPRVWKAVIADAVAHKRRPDGYSYVYVHRNVPQKLTLWHNGKTILTSPGNTGVPAAPTALGTWPVFEHISVGRMSGTNPDGSHYDDPGIRWISYFHGGEALHAFNRASFGTPQSLGCVELPLESAAKVWPYTPIGTLVTIEN